jgi:Methyltransferase domain
MDYFEHMKEYYERRAEEYDDAYLGTGAYSGRTRPGFEEELAQVTALIEGLSPVRTIDLGCGTGFMTLHLKGEVVGLDQSAAMLEIARGRVLGATFVQGDAFDLPSPTAHSTGRSSVTFWGSCRHPLGRRSSKRPGGSPPSSSSSRLRPPWQRRPSIGRNAPYPMGRTTRFTGATSQPRTLPRNSAAVASFSMVITSSWSLAKKRILGGSSPGVPANF